MRLVKGIGGLLAVALVAACQQGGGGGELEEKPAPQAVVASPSPAGVDAGLARDYLGNAFVSSARVHTAIVDGQYQAARNNLNNVRRQMMLAERHATLEQQRTINRLEGLVIDLQADIEAQNPGSMQTSQQLVRSFFDYYQQLATAGGGAGMAPPEDAYPPPAQPRPAPVIVPERQDPVGAEDPYSDTEQPYSP